MAKKNDSFEPAPRKNFELCTIKEQASLAVDVLRKTINKMRVRTPEKNQTFNFFEYGNNGLIHMDDSTLGSVWDLAYFTYRYFYPRDQAVISNH